MKVYEVECRAVITIAEEDMQKAALHCAAVIKDNPHLIHVTAVHEQYLEPAWKDPNPKNSPAGVTCALSAGAAEDAAPTSKAVNYHGSLDRW
jgi:hypothetical protein